MTWSATRPVPRGSDTGASRNKKFGSEGRKGAGFGRDERARKPNCAAVGEQAEEYDEPKTAESIRVRVILSMSGPRVRASMND